MINFIRQFVDYILLNACSVNSIGLYNGKAGLSLCLFEYADYLKDERIEEQAFDLLQESLALSGKSKDISFENGLSGVGFLLAYLIKNQFIDADFEELYGQQLQTILKAIKERQTCSERELPLIRFLHIVKSLSKEIEITPLIHRILEDAGESIERQLETFLQIHSNTNKIKTLTGFDEYSKTIALINHKMPQSLQQLYLDLCQQGKIADNSQNKFIDALTLAQHIDWLYLTNQKDDALFDFSNPQYEKYLVQKIPPRSLIAGYGDGIARLLLFWIYKQKQSNQQDCSRFKLLF